MGQRNHQRQVFVTMKQWRKRQNLNYEVTSGFANSGNRSTHAEKRKLTFANGRTQKAMGQLPSKKGFCHHQTM